MVNILEPFRLTALPRNLELVVGEEGEVHNTPVNNNIPKSTMQFNVTSSKLVHIEIKCTGIPCFTNI
jgi:hypothetical protein